MLLACQTLKSESSCITLRLQPCPELQSVVWELFPSYMEVFHGYNYSLCYYSMHKLMYNLKELSIKDTQ